MTRPEPPNTDTHQRIARLRELLKQPSSKDRVAPLVTALMARDVDLHERMLTDLANRVQQIEASTQSEDTGRLLERMQNIEEDAKSLRQLITEVGQSVTETKADQRQLQVELTNAIDQNRARIVDAEQQLEAIGEKTEERLKTNAEIMEILGAMAKNRQRLQRNVDEIKNALEGMQPTPVSEKMTKVFKLTAEYLNHTSFIAGMESKQGTGDGPTGNISAWKGSVEEAIDQSTDGNEPHLYEFPAITDFLVIYDQFVEIYKYTPPKNESQFIQSFLGSLNVHVSCAVQRQLLKICPSKAALATVHADQSASNIFIDLGRMDWKTIRRAIPKIKDLRILQWALNEGLTGPPPSRTAKEEKKQYRRSSRIAGIHGKP
ncbi:hypothetical protein GGR50DRAFT_43873 [Xylaria sp. CBS 124048]|nr:hypothetical protein GGR50DRAFT_43873 [Xylaria sp. CBS 124048]